MIYIFIAIACILILVQYKLEGRIVNLISILMVPYIFNVTINNFVVCDVLGFFKVSDDVIEMLMLAFMSFFIGALLPSICYQHNNIIETDNILRFNNYHIKQMAISISIIGIIGIIKLTYMCLLGVFNAEHFDLSEGLMGMGIVGHLLILSYSIVPIVFLYWTYNPKKLRYLIGIILIFIATFSTFIKYNIIALAVNIVIFTLIYRKSVLFKSILFLCLFTVIVFIANYMIGFIIRDADVNPLFYVNHLWVYISGSIIYDNYIFTNGIRIGVDIFYKLMTFICALPNMFFYKICDFRVFPHIRQEPLPIGRYGQRSNVVDAIGYLYPSGGSSEDVLVFISVMIIIGFVFACIYVYSKRTYRHFNTFISIFLTYFVFFSFFGTFYINSAPWESLVYAMIIPKLFIKKRSNL